MRLRSKSFYFTFLTLLYAVLATSMQGQNTDNSFCWKSSFGRGVGTIASACPNGYNKELAMCYTTCQSGYEAYTPGAVVCERQCRSNFTDLAGSCGKPAPTSSAGYPWKVGDAWNLDAATARCTAANRSVGCYVSGAIVYPNCAAGFKKVGDLVCSPVCPSGTTDIGALCIKNDSYTRTLKSAGCSPGMTNEAGLCYASCGDGFQGTGPVCWSSCPADQPFACGAACATSQKACANAVGTMVYDSVAVVLNIASIALGGEGAGITDAGRAALEAGQTAKAASVAARIAETGESTLMNSIKTFGVGFGKTFAKQMAKNQLDNRNLFWNASKATNNTLSAINKAATEYGKQKGTNSFDLNSLAAVDPSGISSLVMSFAKWGSCNSSQFSVDKKEMSFPSASSPNGQTQTFTITAQRPMTITRLATPALMASTITPAADCVGKQMNPSDTCLVSVNVNSKLNLDAEVRIFTNEYTSFPATVHILANPTVQTVESSKPNVDEAANLTDIQGVWAYANDQNQLVKITSQGAVTISGSGALGSAGYVVPAGDSGRAFAFRTEAYQQTVTLNEAGDHLTSAPLPGYIGVKDTPFVLSLDHYRTDNGTHIIQWNNNGVPAQNFTFDPLGDGTYRIVSALSGKVLHVQNSTMGEDGAIIETDWKGMDSDKFRIETQGDGSYYRIINVNSGLSLTVTGDLNQAGGNVVQRTWSDLPAQRFTLKMDYANLVRRPWDKGCNAGEQKYAGFCYNVPFGYEVTAPGFMGKVCPVDWRDDGTSCWPVWTGNAVAAQADPNGGDNMRHPIMVTDASFSSASCPANYSKGAITCTAIIKSKGVTSIMGHLPN